MAGPFMATILISESAHKNFFDEFLSICSRSPSRTGAHFLKRPPDRKSSAPAVIPYLVMH